MAPPNKRRPGYSRRAQYGNFFSYIAALVGIGLGALLLMVSTGNTGAFSGLRETAADVGAPAGSAAAGGRAATQGLWATIAGYFTHGSRVARLEREVAEARVKLAEQAALKDENARLKALVGLTEGERKPVAITRLVGSTSSSTRRFAMIGAGSSQGVRPGMAVRSPLGLVGRVLEVGSSSARILLITDTESTIPVRRAEGEVQAYAIGQGDGTLRIRLAVTGLNPLRQGDAMVTTGSGGIYQPGQAVAVVIALTPDGAIARPLSDPAMTDHVAVEPLFEAPAELSASATGGQ